MKHRLLDHDGATADDTFIVDRAPTLLEPRIALIAALAALRRSGEARAQRQTLVEQGGVPPEVLAALEDVIAQPAPAGESS